MKKIYKGFLVSDVIEQTKEYAGKECIILDLEDNENCIFWKIEEDLWDHGHHVQIQYFISEQEIHEDDRNKILIDTLFGLTDMGTESYGCPTCGLYYYSDFTVGGHDLHKELQSYIGKYCILEIDYTKTKEDLEFDEMIRVRNED